ncbi:hypothetical protein OF83DRAFT_1170467 [Amylostereum chailletii]|nr:hypothetical protein OF83DRAFT_1170467 [Amylostereum chailletii]
MGRITARVWRGLVAKVLKNVQDLDDIFDYGMPRDLVDANACAEMDTVLQAYKAAIATLLPRVAQYPPKESDAESEDSEMEATPVRKAPTRRISEKMWRNQLARCLKNLGNLKEVFDDVPVNFTEDDVRDALLPVFNLLKSSHSEIEERRAHAESVPVTKIPDEFLAEVFRYVAAVDPPQGACRFPARKSTRGWTNLGRVCTRWSKVLRECPDIWANSISDVADSRFQEIMLANAGSRPLAFTLRSTQEGDGNDERSMKLILKHLGQARELRLDLFQAAWENVTRDLRAALEGKTWPLLEVIDIKVATAMKESEDDVCWFDPFELGFDIDMASMVAPVLRRCRLHNTFLPWDPTSITHLTLTRNRYMPRDGLPKARAFFASLAKSVNLEVLYIDGCLPRLPKGPSVRLQRVVLPNLRELVLYGTPMRCALMVDHLDVPSSVWLDFKLYKVDFMFTTAVLDLPPEITDGKKYARKLRHFFLTFARLLSTTSIASLSLDSALHDSASVDSASIDHATMYEDTRESPATLSGGGVDRSTIFSVEFDQGCLNKQRFHDTLATFASIVPDVPVLPEEMRHFRDTATECAHCAARETGDLEDVDGSESQEEGDNVNEAEG